MVANCDSLAGLMVPYVELICLSVLFVGLTCLAALVYWCLTAPDYDLEPDWFHKVSEANKEGDSHE